MRAPKITKVVKKPVAEYERTRKVTVKVFRKVKK